MGFFDGLYGAIFARCAVVCGYLAFFGLEVFCVVFGFLFVFVGFVAVWLFFDFRLWGWGVCVFSGGLGLHIRLGVTDDLCCMCCLVFCVSS